MTDDKCETSAIASIEPLLKSLSQSLISSSQDLPPASENPAEGTKTSTTLPSSIFTQDKYPSRDGIDSAVKPQVGTTRSRKLTPRHTKLSEIGVIIDLICQLVDFTVVRVDVIFVQDLSSTLSIPKSIQTAIDSCPTAKKIQLTPVDCINLSNEVSLPRIVYTISTFDYNHHIKDIGKKTRNFATERLDGVLVRYNVCIPPALLNWSLPVTIANNTIKREEHSNYKYSIDPLTPNLHTLRPWQREAIEFYLLREGRCMLADPPEMGIAAQALLSAYQHRDSFPLFIIAHTNSIPYWKAQVYRWYNDGPTRSSCTSKWLEEKAAHEAKTNSLKKIALKKASGDGVKVMKRARLRRIHELPNEYNLSAGGSSAIYALGYEDITSRGAFSQLYTQAVQTCFEGVSICKERMVIVLTAHHFITLYSNGLVHTKSATVILTDAQEYKDISSKRTKELSLILSMCPRVLTCVTIASVSFLKVIHPQLTILGLPLGKLDFLARYCEMKKRELRSGKVITTASGMSMHAELAYIFNACCLSRQSERYTGFKKRYILCLEIEKDAHSNGNQNNDIAIDMHDSNLSLTSVVSALAGFYFLNLIPLIIVTHGKEAGSLLTDALNKKGITAENVSERRSVDASLDSVYRFQNGEAAALVCSDDAVSICFAIECTHVCFFVGLLWSSSEISMWESKLQTFLTTDKQQCSIFITGPNNKSLCNTGDGSSRSVRIDTSRHLQSPDLFAKENFVSNLLRSWKVPRWSSYPQISLNTIVSTRIETWVSD